MLQEGLLRSGAAKAAALLFAMLMVVIPVSGCAENSDYSDIASGSSDNASNATSDNRPSDMETMESGAFRMDYADDLSFEGLTATPQISVPFSFSLDITQWAEAVEETDSPWVYPSAALIGEPSEEADVSLDSIEDDIEAWAADELRKHPAWEGYTDEGQPYEAHIALPQWERVKEGGLDVLKVQVPITIPGNPEEGAEDLSVVFLCAYGSASGGRVDVVACVTTTKSVYDQHPGRYDAMIDSLRVVA